MIFTKKRQKVGKGKENYGKEGQLSTQKVQPKGKEDLSSRRGLTPVVREERRGGREKLSLIRPKGRKKIVVEQPVSSRPDIPQQREERGKQQSARS